MPKVVRRSGTNDPAAAATAATAAETMVEIVVNIEGTTIPITLTQSECTELSWGEFCKIVVEKYLPKVDPTLLLKILAKISPNKRLSHYKARVGDGCAIIMKVNWSPAGIPGFARLPFEPSYTEVNMALEPTEGGPLQLMAKPHLPLLQPVEGEPVPTSLDVNLVIMAVSADHPPLPSNVARTSVVTINEHLSFPGCLDKFSVEAANGENDILPDQSSLAVSSSAPVTAATAAGKRKASPKQATASTKKKAKNAKKTVEEGTSKSDNDGAKKAAAKKGGAAAAAKKKSPPEESAAEESKTPSKKAGMDMIRRYEAAKAKQLNESSSSSKTDSPSIPKVISSKKTTKITPKKGKATTTAAKDDGAAKKPSASAEEVGRDRALSIDKGNEMLRVYEESKAKGNASAGKENKTPSKKSKESGESTKSSSSSKKTTKSSSKKGKAKGDEEKSAKKPPAAAAAAKEDSGEDDKAAPSVDNGKKMLSVWLAAQEKEAGSKKTEDSTKPSGKKAKGSSKKKDGAKAEKGESSTKKPSAAEEGKSAKKKAKTAAASEATKVSKKKRKAPSSEDNTADASKSPSKKKAKSSKGDEKSTPAKDDGKKSAAASKKADSEVKKRGPKRKDYDDIPSEPAADFPEGWTSKNIPRSSGDKYDQRWYSPGGMTFNTKKGATMFEEFVKDGNDEATAYKLFKTAEKEAKEKRKAKKEAEAMEKK